MIESIMNTLTHCGFTIDKSHYGMYYSWIYHHESNKTYPNWISSLKNNIGSNTFGDALIALRFHDINCHVGMQLSINGIHYPLSPLKFNRIFLLEKRDKIIHDLNI